MRFFDDARADKFHLFSTTHLSIIFFLFISIILIYIFRKRIRNNPTLDRSIRISLITLNILFCGFYYYWLIYNQYSFIENGLPLHLCSLSTFLITYALITRSRRVFEVLYFWSIGALFAIITPNITQGTNNALFYSFFITHIIIVIGTIYLLLIYRYNITFKSLVNTSNYTIVLFFITYIFNKKYDANYMFTNLPVNDTPLEIMEKLPMFNTYLIPLFIFGFFVCFLIYSPWLFINRLPQEKNI